MQIERKDVVIAIIVILALVALGYGVFSHDSTGDCEKRDNNNKCIQCNSGYYITNNICSECSTCGI